MYSIVVKEMDSEHAKGGGREQVSTGSKTNIEWKRGKKGMKEGGNE
jgi:hypothetical protein